MDKELEVDGYSVNVPISELDPMLLVVILPELELVGDHDSLAVVELEGIAAVETETDVDPLLDNSPLVDAELELNLLNNEVALLIVDGVCKILKLGLTVVVFVKKGLLVVETVVLNTLVIVLQLDMDTEVDLLNTAVILTDMDTDELFDMDEVLVNVSDELPVANSVMVTEEEPLVDMEPVEEELSCVLCDMEGDPLIVVEIDMVGVNV
jgi:hypothetical protein